MDNTGQLTFTGELGTTQIADNAITLAKMADNSVDTDELVASAVETTKINDGAVTEPKIADAAIDEKIVKTTFTSNGNLVLPSGVQHIGIVTGKQLRH